MADELVWRVCLEIFIAKAFSKIFGANQEAIETLTDGLQ